MPIGCKPVHIRLDVPRVWCLDCGLSRQVKIGFADPKKHYTRAFERYALELSRHMTIKDVAEHLQVSWDTIKDIQARSLHRRFGKPKLHKLKQIAIDEIAIGKGHRYLTVVLNLLRRGRVRRRWQRRGGPGAVLAALAPCRAKIGAVATDMSKAYIRAVRTTFPARSTSSTTSTSSSCSTKNSAPSARAVPPGSSDETARCSRARAGCC